MYVFNFIYRNDIKSDINTFSNNIKSFNKFKEEYNNQYELKKKELLNSYESKYLKENKNIISKDEIIEIEFSNNEVEKVKLSVLMKHPYSKLASFFSCLEKIPKRNGHIFLDRNYNTFMNLLDFLKTDKIPKINNRTEKCNFFDELDY